MTGGDWESHRIVTRVRGLTRALVYTHATSFTVRMPLGPYAAKVSTFESMEKLMSFVRNRGWRLEKVNWFS